MESWLSTKILLTNILNISLIILSIIAIFASSIKWKYDPLNKLRNKGEDEQNLTELNIVYFYYRIFWFLITQTIIYMIFMEIPINLLTEGSTVMNFITQVISSLEKLAYIWILLIVIRYILSIVLINDIRYMKPYFKRDLVKIFIFVFSLIIGIYFAQRIGIEITSLY